MTLTRIRLVWNSHW